MKNSKAQKIESNITYAINEFLKDIENTKDILKFQKITPESLEASFLKKFEDVLIDELTYKIEQDIKDAGFTKVEYGKDQ